VCTINSLAGTVGKPRPHREVDRQDSNSVARASVRRTGGRLRTGGNPGNRIVLPDLSCLELATRFRPVSCSTLGSLRIGCRDGCSVSKCRRDGGLPVGVDLVQSDATVPRQLRSVTQTERTCLRTQQHGYCRADLPSPATQIVPDGRNRRTHRGESRASARTVANRPPAGAVRPSPACRFHVYRARRGQRYADHAPRDHQHVPSGHGGSVSYQGTSESRCEPL